MQTRASKKKRSKPSPEEEGIKSALSVVEQAIGGELIAKPKNKHAQALSRLGASKGGLARARSMSARKRSEIAKKAAAARWKSPDTLKG